MVVVVVVVVAVVVVVVLLPVFSGFMTAASKENRGTSRCLGCLSYAWRASYLV